MWRTVTGKTEILGTFIGKDEVEAALQGSHSDRAAMARRIASSSGYNGHLAYVQGDGEEYSKIVDAAKRAGKITEPQLAVLNQKLLAAVDPKGTSPHRASLQAILRENLTKSGVKITRA
jgi:hypothetical protein